MSDDAQDQLLRSPPDDAEPFWRRKSLDEMTAKEWESLCDGCGRCCLVKLQDADSGQVHYTDVSCKLLDSHGCGCSNYKKRQTYVKDCRRLTPTVVRQLSWLPFTCAYRRLAEGQDLAWWHPLVSGDRETVHAAGISVRGRVSGLEGEFSVDELLDKIVTWPWHEPEQVSKP